MAESNLNELLEDKIYIEKLKDYTSAYLQIEKTIPHGFRIQTMKKIGKLLRIQKELFYRELEIQIESTKRGGR